MNDGDFAPGYGVAGNLLLQPVAFAVVADVAAQRVATSRTALTVMMPAVAGLATTSVPGQQELIQDTAGDIDAGVVKQQLVSVDVPGDGAAAG